MDVLKLANRLPLNRTGKRIQTTKKKKKKDYEHIKFSGTQWKQTVNLVMICVYVCMYMCRTYIQAYYI